MASSLYNNAKSLDNQDMNTAPSAFYTVSKKHKAGRTNWDDWVYDVRIVCKHHGYTLVPKIYVVDIQIPTTSKALFNCDQLCMGSVTRSKYLRCHT